MSKLGVPVVHCINGSHHKPVSGVDFRAGRGPGITHGRRSGTWLRTPLESLGSLHIGRRGGIGRLGMDNGSGPKRRIGRAR